MTALEASMTALEAFRLSQIPASAVAVAATDEVGYESSRMMLVNRYDLHYDHPLYPAPNGPRYIVIEGFHCSCYGYDNTTWKATAYSEDDLRQLAKSSWAISPLRIEAQFAVGVRAYLR